MGNKLTAVALSVLSGGMVLTGVGVAQAASVDAAAILDHYALITKGDYDSTQEVEGNIYIGGNASGTVNFDQGGSGDASSNFADAVVLGTNLGQMKGVAGSSTVYVGNNANFIENAGQVYYGSNNGTIQNVTGATPGNPGSTIVPEGSDVFAVLDALSASYASMSPSTSYLTDAGSQIYTFGAGVYSVDMAEFANGWNVAFNLNADETAIINVTGASAVSTFFNFELTDFGFADRVIWNFVDATDLILGGSAFTGTVLAGNATVSGFSGSPEGTIYANRVLQYNGEIHGRGFVDTGLPAVPLPAGLPLLAGALGAFGMIRRKQQKRQS